MSEDRKPRSGFRRIACFCGGIAYLYGAYQFRGDQPAETVFLVLGIVLLAGVLI